MILVKWRVLGAPLLAFALLPERGLADTPSASPSASPSPVPLPTTVSAEDEYTPDYKGETGSSNLINLRAQIPYDNSAYVVRLKLPIVTLAPPASDTGAGDLSLWDLAVINASSIQWLAGLTFRIPTGQGSLSTNKYSLGPAFGYTIRPAPWTVGFFQQNFFSVIGPSSYPGVSRSIVEPVARRGLSNGWSIGLSTMQFTYDWVRNRWINAPIGLRVEKQGIARLEPLGAYFEFENNLAHAVDSPAWTVRTLFRWTFLPAPNAEPSDDQE